MQQHHQLTGCDGLSIDCSIQQEENARYCQTCIEFTMVGNMLGHRIQCKKFKFLKSYNGCSQAQQH